MSDYEFDVFISYRRKGNPHDWVKHHFHPRLSACLADQMPEEPKVFIDEGMEIGTVWPDRLEDALRRTRILVPVFSPQYFRSSWCLAEWHSMAARERLVGQRGLIYPVLFSDSENFPSFARERSWRDLKRWNKPDLVFQQTVRWIDFVEEIENVAIDLARLIGKAPPWEETWPIERPNPPMPGMTPVPRF